MKLLADQDVYGATVALLRSLGHDVVTVRELGMARGSDLELLEQARDLQRIFITRDRDFGALVFLGGSRVGVIYLRMTPSQVRAVHLELERVLASYSEGELRAAFAVVEAGSHRIRRLPH